jgi:antitoxin (DNA-binding transcriptional repressor) of toxin-antitoxin stability system
MLRMRRATAEREGATMATLTLQEVPALAEALAKAAPGEAIAIMDGEREVARVAPAPPTPDEMVALMRARRRPTTLTTADLKAMVDEGRL